MTADSEQGPVASFKKIDVGIINQTLAEVTAGLTEGETVVTTGAAALREGDRILLPGQSAAPGGEGQRGGQGGDGRRGGGQGRGRGNQGAGTPTT